MTEAAVFEQRREALIARLVALVRDDDRLVALWLQGSLADGSADPLSDVDAYVAVRDEAYEEVYGARMELAGRLGAVLASMESPALRAVHCLLEGPVKLDLFFVPASEAPEAERPAVRVLVDKAELAPSLKSGWMPPVEEAARRVDATLRLTFQGASWPVRLLERGQLSTFAMVELELVNDQLALLLAAQLDGRLLFKNRLSLPRLLRPEQRALIDELTRAVVDGVTRRDLVALRDAHLRINEALAREGKAACAALGIPFPLSEEAYATLRTFYERDWPEALPQ